jgi:hypothetical protein
MRPSASGLRKPRPVDARSKLADAQVRRPRARRAPALRAGRRAHGRGAPRCSRIHMRVGLTLRAESLVSCRCALSRVLRCSGPPARQQGELIH